MGLILPLKSKSGVRAPSSGPSLNLSQWLLIKWNAIKQWGREFTVYVSATQMVSLLHLGPLSRFLWWRQLDNGEGMAVAPLSGILGRLDLLPASQ